MSGRFKATAVLAEKKQTFQSVGPCLPAGYGNDERVSNEHPLIQFVAEITFKIDNNMGVVSLRIH